MANRERGEMTLHAGGQDYTLRLTTNSCCELEDRTGKSVEEWLDAWNKKHRVTALRWLLWAALQDHHKSIAATPEAAGDIIDLCDQNQLMQLMASFMMLNIEERMKLIADGLLAEAPVPKGRASDPPRAQTDAGESSTSRHVQ